MQVSAPPLADWLRHSGGPVAVSTVQGLMRRLEKHEPADWEDLKSAVSCLHETDLPQMICSEAANKPNPALMCLVHLCQTAEGAGRKHLPHTGELQQAGENEQSSGSLDCQSLGEVWWLLHGGQLHLAEVFKHGAVPSMRLPHLQRDAADKTKLVARLLGSTPRVILVEKVAWMCMFSPWCDLAFCPL